MMLPEWNHDFLPTTMVYKLGWLPYLLLLAVLAVLLLWICGDVPASKARAESRWHWPLS